MKMEAKIIHYCQSYMCKNLAGKIDIYCLSFQKKLQSEAGGQQEKREKELYDIEEEKSKLSEELMSLKDKLRQKDRQILILEGRVSSSPRSSSLERQTSCEAKVTDIEEKLKVITFVFCRFIYKL